MRTGAAAGHSGFFHETGFYGSDEEFLALVIPFLEDGLAAGEPTVSAFAERPTALVRDVLGAAPGLIYLDADTRYSRPATTIQLHRQFLGEQVAHGAAQIRIAGDVPHPGTGSPWDCWARYESAVNIAYAEYPFYGLCPYDTRTTPNWVLDEVSRTHPHIATPDGHHLDNDRFESPGSFWASRRSPNLDPLLRTAPTSRLSNPTPSAARAAVRDAARTHPLDPDEIEALTYAVSEAVTNAERYGRPPVELRIWATQRRITATVTDTGPGPSDPCVGLLPSQRRSTQSAGAGLWLSHKWCTDVSLMYRDDGFTVAFTVGAPPNVAA